MLVQDVINASSIDYRQVLSASTPDSTLFISWVDRIHKDALHTGIYNQLIQLTSTISVVSGTSSYTIPVTGGAIRRIQLVYDRTFDRVVFPLEGIVYPTQQGDSAPTGQAMQLPAEMVNAETQAQYPKYYKREGTTSLYLFPAPQKAAFNGTYEVHYEMQVPDLTTTAATLLLPDDAMDMVAAGVNMYVGQFLHLDTETQFWSGQYEAYKKAVPVA